MKNVDLFMMKDVVTNICNSGSNKFKLDLLINEELLDDRISKIRKLFEPSGIVKKYQDEYKKLVVKYAELDEYGEPIVYEGEGGNGKRLSGKGIPNIIKDKEEFLEKKEELMVKHKKAIEEEIKISKEFQEMLEEEASEINFIKINVEDLPEIQYNYMRTLKPMLKIN